MRPALIVTGRPAGFEARRFEAMLETAGVRR
jgi:hypothetical protein